MPIDYSRYRDMVPTYEQTLRFGVVVHDPVTGCLVEMLEKPVLKVFDDGMHLIFKGDDIYLSGGRNIEKVT